MQKEVKPTISRDHALFENHSCESQISQFFLKLCFFEASKHESRKRKTTYVYCVLGQIFSFAWHCNMGNTSRMFCFLIGADFPGAKGKLVFQSTATAARCSFALLSDATLKVFESYESVSTLSKQPEAISFIRKRWKSLRRTWTNESLFRFRSRWSDSLGD